MKGKNWREGLRREVNSFKEKDAESLRQLQQSSRRIAYRDVEDIKSMKGDYQGYAEHPKAKVIHTISSWCFNLLAYYISLPSLKEKKILIFLNPLQKVISRLSDKKESVKKKREILSDTQIVHGIFTLLATMYLHAIISAIAKRWMCYMRNKI